MIRENVTIDEIEDIVARLEPEDQLRLVAQITNGLSRSLSRKSYPSVSAEQKHREQLLLAEALLSEVADITDDSEGKFDAATTIQKLRDERINQLCQY